MLDYTNLLSPNDMKKNDKMFYKILVISIICDKCGSKPERIFKEEESFEALKILCVIKKPQAFTLD